MLEEIIAKHLGNKILNTEIYEVILNCIRDVIPYYSYLKRSTVLYTKPDNSLYIGFKNGVVSESEVKDLIKLLGFSILETEKGPEYTIIKLQNG